MIIALKEQSRIFLAADTLFRDGNNKYFNHKKIVQCNSNEVLMAGCGNPQIVQEILSGYQFPDTIPNIENCSIYLSNINKQFKNNHQFHFQFLIAGDGRIININSEGLVCEAIDFEVIGQGRELALVGLELTANLPPELRLKSIFNSVIKYTDYVGGEINIQVI